MDNDIKYLKRAKITGLWGKKDIDWPLHRDVNILAGINGSGKTTILDGICGLLVKGTLHKEHYGKIKEVSLFFNNDKHIDYKYIKIKGSISDLEERAKHDKTIEDFLIRLKRKESHEYYDIKRTEAEVHSTSFADVGMGSDDIRKLICIDIISTFDNKLKPIELLSKLSDDIRTDLDLEIYSLQKHYLDYQLSLGRKKDAIIESGSDDFKFRLDELKKPYNRFIEIINEAFSATGKRINSEKNELEFVFNEGGLLNAYKLSSGEKQLLIILLTVLIQDQKVAILFMDEPEISLHIEWQKSLIRYIRELNPNAQVIIATHSPAMIMDGWFDKVFDLSSLP